MATGSNEPKDTSIEMKDIAKPQGTLENRDNSQAAASKCCRIKCDAERDVDFIEQTGHYLLLALKILIMMVFMILISLNKDISNAKPCELQQALSSIRLQNSHNPCKNNKVKETSCEQMTWMNADLSFNCIHFLLMILFGLVQCKINDKKTPFRIAKSTIICVIEIVFFGVSICKYSNWVNQEEETMFNYLDLKKSMISSLEEHYKSDDINPDDKDSISTLWNTFFIQYDCCAVNEVIGTYNDFDNTTWCKTVGSSCQATTSQIPRTCCKDVTQENYQKAPSNCYSSVIEGTYKSSCIARMKSLSRTNINEFQVSMISIFLHVTLILKIMASLVIIIDCSNASWTCFTEIRQ